MNVQSLVVLDRRKFLLGATALVAAGLMSKRVLALAGPMKFSQGAAELTVLSDGSLILPIGMLAPDADPKALAELLKDAAKADGTVELATHPTLVKDGAELILFDTGAGGGFQPTAGKLLESLAEAGIDPASITKVAFTHGHPDHLFGTSKDGKLLLPNASYHVAQAEWDFWNGKEIFNILPKEMHGMATGAQANYGAMKDKVSMFKPGDAISANITVLDTPGHTPGHVSFLVAGGDNLIIAGDVIPTTRVHFAHPEWRMAFDGDPPKAIASRKALLDRSATDKVKLLGYHWATPVGYVERKDSAYVLAPVA